MTADARLLSPNSTDADLLSAAALAQQVGADEVANELKAQAVANRLAARRARNLGDALSATDYSFDEAM